MQHAGEYKAPWCPLLASETTELLVEQRSVPAQDALSPNTSSGSVLTARPTDAVKAWCCTHLRGCWARQSPPHRSTRIPAAAAAAGKPAWTKQQAVTGASSYPTIICSTASSGRCSTTYTSHAQPGLPVDSFPPRPASLRRHARPSKPSQGQASTLQAGLGVL